MLQFEEQLYNNPVSYDNGEPLTATDYENETMLSRDVPLSSMTKFCKMILQNDNYGRKELIQNIVLFKGNSK